MSPFVIIYIDESNLIPRKESYHSWPSHAWIMPIGSMVAQIVQIHGVRQHDPCIGRCIGHLSLCPRQDGFAG